ncbi:hypothetical protein HDU98_001832 [Podochytrium sp. JEL0797]|nr:hypothetical protein HDU98_001832 [Podochytrium sp. JEL0797]
MFFPAALLTLAACALGQKSYTINIGTGSAGIGISTTSLTINVGDNVVWANTGISIKEVQQEAGPSDCTPMKNALFGTTQLFPGSQYAYTFRNTTTAYFYINSVLNDCSQGADGVIHVQTPPSPSPSPQASATVTGGGGGNGNNNHTVSNGGNGGNHTVTNGGNNTNKPVGTKTASAGASATEGGNGGNGGGPNVLPTNPGGFPAGSPVPEAPLTPPASHLAKRRISECHGASGESDDLSQGGGVFKRQASHADVRKALLLHTLPDEDMPAEAQSDAQSDVKAPPASYPLPILQQPIQPSMHSFLDRMSSIPLIHSTLSSITSTYEATKNANSVMKSSAEMVESSTMAVLNSLEPALTPFDRFACTQLDKFGFGTTPTPTPASMTPTQDIQMECMDDSRSDSSHPTTASYSFREGDRNLSQREGSIRSESNVPFYDHHEPLLHETPHYEDPKEMEIPYHEQHQQQPSVQNPQHLSEIIFSVMPFRRHRSGSVSSTVSSCSSTGSASTVGYESFASSTPYSMASSLQESTSSSPVTSEASSQLPLQQETGNSSTAPTITRKPRGMWTTVVQGVQSNLGAMVVSEDTVRALKWCLKLLQEAARYIEAQVDILRRYLASYLKNYRSIDDPSASPITPEPNSPTTNNNNTANAQANTDLHTAISSVTQEIVHALKFVVDMLVRHASSRLPPPAKKRVREFILQLPSQFNTLATDFNTHPPPTPQNGPTDTDATAESISAAAVAAEKDAQRVLTLAAESSAMLKNVMHVFSQTVSGAEAVLGRTVESDDSGMPSMAGLKISGAAVAGNGGGGEVGVAVAAAAESRPVGVQIPLSIQQHLMQNQEKQQQPQEMELDLD